MIYYRLFGQNTLYYKIVLVRVSKVYRSTTIARNIRHVEEP